MRRLLTSVFRIVLKVFFRTTAIDGLERFPPSGPTVIVLNHPNALLDPLVLLCRSPRPVSFLAKAPLFRMPVIGAAVRAFDSIPVHRRQDQGSDPSKNRETFSAARDLLARGGVLALFPEGVSHDDPRMRPLKTGAARIVLGAGGVGTVRIVPAGLAYTAKQIFRSDVLLTIGAPFDVTRAAPEAGGEPSAEAVDALTARIDEALDAVTLQADGKRALELATAAEGIFSAEADPAVALPERVAIRRLILERYGALRARDPRRLAALERRVVRLARVLEHAGLAPEDLAAGVRRPGRLAARAAATLAGALLVAPFAAVGVVTHWPAYRLVALLAARLSKGTADLVATVKLLAGLVLFPLTWLLAALAAWRLGSPCAAAATAVVLPLCGLLGLLFVERLGRSRAALRAVSLSVFRQRGAARLADETRALADEMRRADDELRRGA